MLTNEEKGGIITKLSHGAAEKKSLKQAWIKDFREKTGLDWYRASEKNLKKSLKKLLTKATKCDMINKSPNERKTSESDNGLWKLNNVKTNKNL